MFDGDHSKLGAQQTVDDSVGAAVQHQEDVVEVAYYQGPQRKHLEFIGKKSVLLIQVFFQYFTDL